MDNAVYTLSILGGMVLLSADVSLTGVPNEIDSSVPESSSLILRMRASAFFSERIQSSKAHRILCCCRRWFGHFGGSLLGRPTVATKACKGIAIHHIRHSRYLGWFRYSGGAGRCAIGIDLFVVGDDDGSSPRLTRFLRADYNMYSVGNCAIH
jgi:hypothetical protein